MLSLKERYDFDPAFNALVKLMLAQICQGQFTPSELRQAAMLAAIQYEMMQPPKPIILEEEEKIIKYLNRK